MALSDFLAELDALADEAAKAFEAAADGETLEATRISFLGAKSGRLKDVQKGIGKVEKVDKPAAGKRLNEVKTQINDAFEAAKANLAEKNQGPRRRRRV